MQLALRSHRRDTERGGLFLTTNVISFYLPGLSRDITECGNFIHVPGSTELMPLIRQTRWARQGVIHYDIYLDCLDHLLEELSRCHSRQKIPDMKRPMERIRKQNPRDWETFLFSFACYTDLLDKDCLAAPSHFRDTLSRYITELLPLIAATLPLEVSLSFVDLLDNSHFSAGMKKLWEFLPRKKQRKLKGLRGRVDLYLTEQPSTRIRDYVKWKLGMMEPDMTVSSFDLPVGFESGYIRRLVDEEDDLDDEVEFRGFGDDWRRRMRQGRSWDAPFSVQSC